MTVNLNFTWFLLSSLPLIVLKMTHYIDWPWVVILSPILVFAALAALMFFIVGLFFMGFWGMRVVSHR